MFEAPEAIVSLHEDEDASAQMKPILTDLFTFIEDDQEMCRVLLSPHGDMNFPHRLNEAVRNNTNTLEKRTVKTPPATLRPTAARRLPARKDAR